MLYYLNIQMGALAIRLLIKRIRNPDFVPKLFGLFSIFWHLDDKYFISNAFFLICGSDIFRIILLTKFLTYDWIRIYDTQRESKMKPVLSVSPKTDFRKKGAEWKTSLLKPDVQISVEDVTALSVLKYLVWQINHLMMWLIVLKLSNVRFAIFSP